MLDFLKGVINLQLFAADGGDGSGGSGDGSNAGSSQGSSGGDGNDGNKGGDDKKPFAVFPDADSFHARMSREGKKWAAEQFKALGFENFDAGMEALKAAVEAQNAAKTDLDKAKEEAAKAAKERDDAKSIAENALRKATFVAQATAAGVPADRIDDAYLLLSKDDIKVDLTAGTVEGMDDAVKALLEARPWLKGDASTGPTPPGTSAGNSGRASGSAAPTPQEKGKQWAEIHGTVSRSTVGYRPPEWGPAPGSKNS